MINKNKEQSSWEAFYTNFLKDGAGGGVIYTAKRTLPIIGNDFDNAVGYWFNRALVNFGDSMVFNASLNKDLLESYYFEIYGLNMRFKLKNKFDFKLKISGSTVVMLGTNIFFQGKFDFARSLKYGAFYFDMTEKMYNISDNASGFAMRNIIYVDPKLPAVDYKPTVIHELIHTYQFMDFTAVRNMLNPVGERYIFTEDSVMKKISNYIYFDYPTLFAAYSFLQDYDSSTVEGEANFYMHKIRVNKNN